MISMNATHNLTDLHDVIASRDNKVSMQAIRVNFDRIFKENEIENKVVLDTQFKSFIAALVA